MPQGSGLCLRICLLWAFVGVIFWNLILDLQMVPDFGRRLLLWGLFWFHTFGICSIWIPAYGSRYVTQVLNWFGSRIVRSLADRHELRLWVFRSRGNPLFHEQDLGLDPITPSPNVIHL